MPNLNISQLRVPMTRKEVLTWLLDLLQANGFETTGWQDGRIQKTILRVVSAIAADMSEIAKSVVEFGFNDYATGDPLNEFSQSRFANKKAPALATVGPMTLTSTATIAYVIQPGQLIASTDDGIQFRNVDGGTLPAGGALPLTWQCTVQGSIGNVALNAVRRLVTSLAGVSVLNNLGSPWYTTSGLDEESDASIQARNRTQWATLSVELIGEAYEHIARDLGATKVVLNDQNPRGAGTIDVYVSGSRAVLSAPEVAAVQLGFSQRVFQTDSASPPASDSRVAVLSPLTQALDITASIYHDPSFVSADIDMAVRLVLRDFLDRTPIGGWDYGPGPQNVVTVGDLHELLETIEGVETAVMSSPSANVAINPLKLVIEGAWTLTCVPVAG